VDGPVHRAETRDRSAGEAGVTRRLYGRTDYAEPLVELGTVDDATDVRGANDDEWIELVAFPEQAIHWIIRDGQEVDDG
jgi:hypothetical protein